MLAAPLDAPTDLASLVDRAANGHDVGPNAHRDIARAYQQALDDLEREQSARAEAGRQRDVISARLAEVEEELTRAQSDLVETRRTLSQLLLVHLRQPNERTGTALATLRTAGLL